MRKIIIAMGMASLLGLAIPCSAQFGSDSCGCAALVDDGNGYRIPADYDMAQGISHDGKWLLFVTNEGDGGAYVLNLITLERKQIIVSGGGLPHNHDISWDNPIWCPYDSDLVALNVTTLDPQNNGGSGEVQNIFTYRASTGESKLITPQIYDPISHGDRIIGSWLLGSKPGMDSIIVQYGGGAGIYVPQTQALIYRGPFPGLPGAMDTFAFSPNNLHSLSFWRDSNISQTTLLYFLDGKKLITPRAVQTLSASFSPNSNLIALSVQPTGIPSDGSEVYQQVWIFSTDSSSPSSVQIINFQCLFCTYNVLGAYAVFLTDSTLAVSMHKDGLDTSALYEITIDGRIVRKLTYVPENSVAVAQARP